MNADPSGSSLESIFARALEKTSPAERAAYLDGGADPKAARGESK